MDDDMKLSAKTIKRLRTERAWSQEQLAEIADVSLRTIQRAEADGSASRETRMALAAAFDIDLRDLAEPESATPEPPSPSPVPSTIHATPKQYRVVGMIALLAAVLSVGASYFSSEAMPWIFTTLAPMTAIAGGLYAGFGWYFSGRTQPSTPARRTVQFGFITCALVLLFSSLSASPRATATAYLQMMLFACAIRHAFDWYFSRGR
ncbi:helix-turn-helix domain-containing protein [Oxalobacteraceae bacterium OTU3CAMAD1]|nr:helix-turn-helix domain-containing protein [Oxalobacteraceae bacterium OTU3CAMAD1]